MESTTTSEEKSKKKKTGYLKYTGILLLLVGLIILFFTYQPFLSSYFDYRFSPQPPQEIKVEITPNEHGNVFLFAHSTVNFYERRKYNVYLYLLGELQKDDSIYVSYEGEMYKYKVVEFKVVKPEEIKYLGKYMDQDTLTLMTCWPVGSNTRRGIVTAVRDIE